MVADVQILRLADPAGMTSDSSASTSLVVDEAGPSHGPSSDASPTMAALLIATLLLLLLPLWCVASARARRASSRPIRSGRHVDRDLDDRATKEISA